jgi:hypothetical protein
MRLTIVLTAAVVALALAACQPPAETSDAEAPVADAAVSAVPPPMMPADAPPQEEDITLPPEAGSTACSLDQGADAAQRLVNRCIAVSPATHPPCNVANPCQMIQDEIDRACGQYGPGEAKPAECTA